MAKRKLPLRDWFNNARGWRSHDLATLERGLTVGYVDAQDEYGSTALFLAAGTGWLAGVQRFLAAGANTELRYARTGETALFYAVHERHEAIISALVAAGANPDAANHWGHTPRKVVEFFGGTNHFKKVKKTKEQFPEPHIQNAEHLADHYYPRFKIPERDECETLKVGQAVDLHVYGPKSETTQDRVKVRITARRGRRPNVRYTANVETPIEQTHLKAGTTILEFGPENVATVYVPRPKKIVPTKKQARTKKK